MLSPFPGMDPYLESKSLWSDVHASLIPALRAQLTPALPPGFRARVEQELRIEETSQRVRPDIFLSAARNLPPNGGVAVLERPQTEEKTPPLLVRGLREEIPHRFITIIDMNNFERVITTIELLSPANKDVGRGREEYVRKQQPLIASDSHFLEIDLLRGGEYVLAVPLNPELRDADYRVCLHRADAGDLYEVWPISLREPLPTVRVPLTDPHPDLYLDLQAALNRVCEEGGYVADIDYRADPIPPLTPDDATWTDSLLREKGFR